MTSPNVVARLHEEVIGPLKQRFVGRDEVIDLIALALTAGEHLFLHGPPEQADGSATFMKRPIRVRESADGERNFVDRRGVVWEKEKCEWAFEFAGVGWKVEFADRPPIKLRKFSGPRLLLGRC